MATYPTYKFNKKAGRYQYPNGRFVPGYVVDNAIKAVINTARNELGEACDNYKAGRLNLQELQAKAETVIKEVNLGSAVLAKGGWAQMSPGDYLKAARAIKEQYKYFRKYVKQLEKGANLNKRRVMMYANSGRSHFYDVELDLMISRGYDQERSILGVAEHCSDCIEEAGKGWVPIGTLKRIGRRKCLSNDQCRMVYRKKAKRTTRKGGKEGL
jgi:hypothetical protein